jgi:hypothetical protein
LFFCCSCMLCFFSFCIAHFHLVLLLYYFRLALLFSPCIVHFPFALFTFPLCCCFALFVPTLHCYCYLLLLYVIVCPTLLLLTIVHLMLLLLAMCCCYSTIHPRLCCCSLRCCIFAFLPCVGWSLEHLKTEFREFKLRKKKKYVFFK